jgi:hypothetical protein
MPLIGRLLSFAIPTYRDLETGRHSTTGGRRLFSFLSAFFADPISDLVVNLGKRHRLPYQSFRTARLRGGFVEGGREGRARGWGACFRNRLKDGFAFFSVAATGGRP